MSRYSLRPLVRRRVQLGGERLVAAGYDRDTETLEVQLADGSVVQFEGVVMVTFCELVNADDVDRYFATAIERYCRSRQIQPASRS